MKLYVCRKFLENLNTAKFLGFITFVVVNLILVLVLLFYILVGNSDVMEEQPCSQPSNYVVYNKPMIEDFSQWNNNCDWRLVVVNAKNKISPIYNVDLCELAGVDVDRRIVSNLEEMVLDAKEQYGINLFVSSGYRSKESQERRFQKIVDENMEQGQSEEEARKLAELKLGKSECSEHLLGLAVDFNGVDDNFINTPEYAWLLEHSYKYGFVLRYPDSKSEFTGVINKPWHFRFVGETNAKIMKEKNLCLEEYVSGIINDE